jgi:hypothetical protein
MPSHGQNSWRQRATPIAQWLVCFAVAGGGAAWEALRLADARGTVASGWTAGIAAGAGLGLALEVLVAALVLVWRRRPPRSVGRPQSILIRILIPTILLGWFVPFVLSVPPKQNPGHYVITSGIEVADIAYLSIIFAAFAVATVVVPVVRLAVPRKRPLQD